MTRVVVRFEAGRSDDLLVASVALARGCDVHAVRVSRRCHRCGGPHGRPLVDAPGRRSTWASVARSPTSTVVAVAGHPLGVDVEDGDADDPTLRTWVRKEAVLKATGDGLTVDPDRLVLGPPHEPPRVERWLLPARRPPVRIADVDVGPGRLAAVAVVGRRRLRLDVSRR